MRKLYCRPLWPAGRTLVKIPTGRGRRYDVVVLTCEIVALGKAAGVLMDQEADGAVTALYHVHYRPLVRLAALLVQDIDVAEELVQDSFVACTQLGGGSQIGTARFVICIRRS